MGLYEPQPAPGTASRAAIGRILEVAGSGAFCSLDARMLALLAADGPAPPGSIGSHVKLKVGARWVIAQVRSLKRVEADGDLILAGIDFVGEGECGGEDGDALLRFRRGVTHLPLPGCALHAADEADLAAVFATGETAHVRIGTVHASQAIPAALYIDSLLSRHFAILGSTGTGKSSATALVLHRICEAAPHGHVLMIDPHGEYGASFRHTGAVFDVTNLAIPYWLMNLEEHAEIFVTARGTERQGDIDILAKCLLAARGRNRAADGLVRLTPDSPIPYLLSDLSQLLTAEMGKLDKGGVGLAPYQRLRARIEEIKADPRYAFMVSGMLVADSIAPFLTRMLRLGDEGKPIAIVDLSAAPSEVTPVLVALLARLVFDHALWSRGADARPVLLVCEEAHRYIPADADTPARRALERIAKEGRKYGVGLGLVSQRPSDLAEGVLSQCGTIIAMRLNNERDQAYVRSAVPEGGRGLIDAVPALRNREAVVVGEGIAVPTRIVFDALEPDKLPASRDPSFAGDWSRPGHDPARLDRTIARWRAQGR
ncbi:ATP-binding protein [Sphingomonas bacterium]|uniref:ATP-binding protein n=1 Tax=Sphingomonas bacterium TaxID=1895847 RepID=UPI0015751A27|nr:ATP-binding protein [Sphingomonas bacterium]